LKSLEMAAMASLALSLVFLASVIMGVPFLASAGFSTTLIIAVFLLNDSPGRCKSIGLDNNQCKLKQGHKSFHYTEGGYYEM